MSTASRSRYADLVRLLLRYGRSDLVSGAQADEFAVGEASATGGSEETEKAPRLQDTVQPFPFEEVREIVEAELGARIKDLFVARVRAGARVWTVVMSSGRCIAPHS